MTQNNPPMPPFLLISALIRTDATSGSRGEAIPKQEGEKR